MQNILALLTGAKIPLALYSHAASCLCLLSLLCTYAHMHPQVSPDESLSLEDFACRSVLISFVVVNKFGVSQESPPLALTVPGGGSCAWVVSYCINLITGEIVVRAPTNVQVEDEVDKRPGFFGHAVLTISWNDAEGLCLMSPCKPVYFTLCLRLL